MQKVFADKSHLFFPKEKSNRNELEDAEGDAMDVDSGDDASENEDEWTPFELAGGWQNIMSDLKSEE